MILDKKIIYLLLFLFHILFSWTLNSIAYSDFLSNLHNGEGFWFFAVDSIKYHNEAINQLEYLKNSDWISWFNSYKNHVNVKVISLSYWILGNPSPISVSIVNALIWLFSVVLLFRSVQLIFPKNFFLPFLVVTFFFHPSILSQSTQLLRDPYLILGICCFIYGWAILEKNYSRWQWLFYMLAGMLLTVSMRQYLFPIFIIPTLIYMPWVIFYKRWMLFPFAILIVFVGIFQLSYKNNVINIDVNQHIESTNVLNLKIEDFNSKLSKIKKIISNSKYEEFTNDENKAFQDFQLKFLDNLPKNDYKKNIISNLEFINTLEKKYDFLSEIKSDSSVTKVKSDSSVTKVKSDSSVTKVKSDSSVTKVKSDSIDINVIKVKSEPSFINEFKTEVILEFDQYESSFKSNPDLQSVAVISTNFPDIIPSTNPVVSFLDIFGRHIGAIRYDWVRVVVSAGDVGSVVDINTPIYDFYSVLKYIPRALQIGFLAPFPQDFFTTGRAVGRIGYILATAEMLLWYGVLFGFFYSLFVNLSVFRQLIPVFIFSFTIIVLLAYVVPVVGALFRMRQGYMIVFYIYGMYGLQLLYNILSMRKFHSKH